MREKSDYVRAAIYNASGRRIGETVANELLVLAGDDPELVIDCSINSSGLDQCRAKIIDARFQFVEEQLFQEGGLQ